MVLEDEAARSIMTAINRTRGRVGVERRRKAAEKQCAGETFLMTMEDESSRKRENHALRRQRDAAARKRKEDGVFGEDGNDSFNGHFTEEANVRSESLEHVIT